MNIYICTPLKSEKKFKKRQKEIKNNSCKREKDNYICTPLKNGRISKRQKRK
jgi:hypothetical protein